MLVNSVPLLAPEAVPSPLGVFSNTSPLTMREWLDGFDTGSSEGCFVEGRKLSIETDSTAFNLTLMKLEDAALDGSLDALSALPLGDSLCESDFAAIASDRVVRTVSVEETGVGLWLKGAASLLVE